MKPGEQQREQPPRPFVLFPEGVAQVEAERKRLGVTQNELERKRNESVKRTF